MDVPAPRDRGQMFAIGLKAMGALVAAGLLVIMFSEMRTETIRPIALNQTNTTAGSRALGHEGDMWPVAMMGGTVVLVFWGLAIGAIRSRGGLR